jgi:hypothetical protein
MRQAVERMNTFIIGYINARVEEYEDSITNTRGDGFHESLAGHATGKFETEKPK